MDRHVLLVNPNRLRPAVAPIGLDYCADVLLARGIPVELLDLCFEHDPAAAIARALAGREPALIGVSVRNTDDCYLASGRDFLPDLASLVALLRRHSEAPIVLGGSGYSVAPGPILELLGADYGITGDGEEPLAMFARALQEGALAPSAIPGLVWRKGGALRRNPPWLGPLHGLPPRRRELLDNERYFREGGQAGIETKRGCDRRCIYCADPLGKGRRVRPRTPEQVADEFAVLLCRGLDHLHLCDSEFNVPADHALAVCEELARRHLGERACWYTYATPAGFGAELAQAMRRAGCVGVNFGADSGHPAVLAALGRDFTPADLEATADACRRAGLIFMFDLLLGGPGETRATLAQTIRLVKQISPHRVGLSLGVRVYEGTPLARSLAAEGPLSDNPHLRRADGAPLETHSLLHPVFYLSADLGEDPQGYLADLVGGDQRFFFPTPQVGGEAYNYSDNERLVEAISRGCRGAYWDILRRLAESP